MSIIVNKTNLILVVLIFAGGYLYTPAHAVCPAPPDMDFDGDCLVNSTDFAIFAGEWLDCGLYPAGVCP